MNNTTLTQKFQTITFYNTELVTLKVEDVIYTAVKPIAESLGLSWGTQKRKLINQKDKFSWVHMNLTGNDGKIYKMICMPLKKLNGWLFSINPEKVRPDLKERVIQYQEECFEALYNYWHFGKAERKTTVDERTGLRDAVNMLVSKKKLLYPDAYRLIHQRFNVESIEDLESSQLPMAVEYVHKICLEGELIETPQENTNEETLKLIVKLYNACNEAQEMRTKLMRSSLKVAIDNEIGGYYLHNLGMPLKQTLNKARAIINGELKKLDETETVTIDRETARVIVKYINLSRTFAKETEKKHRDLFDALGITRLSGIRNEIAAAAYDLSHEFNYWLDDFTEQVKPRLVCNF